VTTYRQYCKGIKIRCAQPDKIHIQLWVWLEIKKNGMGNQELMVDMVAHSCNPNYSEDRYQKDHG
jgi:hypothetical protein